MANPEQYTRRWQFDFAIDQQLIGIRNDSFPSQANVITCRKRPMPMPIVWPIAGILKPAVTEFEVPEQHVIGVSQFVTTVGMTIWHRRRPYHQHEKQYLGP
jgi:hypothetical protein